MVCFRCIIVNTLHKGDKDNNNNKTILSAMVLIPDMLDQGLINLFLPPRTMFLAQKVVVLSTCSVTTKFLSDRDRLIYDEADNP